MLRDLGYEKKPVLAIDAKATEHILHRQGIGKLKHIDVAYLWIQDEVRSHSQKRGTTLQTWELNGSDARKCCSSQVASEKKPAESTTNLYRAA